MAFARTIPTVIKVNARSTIAADPKIGIAVIGSADLGVATNVAATGPPVG